MAQIDIQAQLKTKFAQPLAPTAVRRIVVWNDPSGEFEAHSIHWSKTASTMRVQPMA